MRSEQAHATREQLLTVATRLFAERGYDRTSVEMVLHETGVSRGALYHHFANKEALFEAVYETAQARVAKEVIAEALTAQTPLEILRTGARSWLQRVRDPVVRQITLIDAPSVLGWQRWREIDAQHFLGTVKAAIEQTVGDRLSPTRIDMLAHMLLASLGELAMVIALGDQSDAAIEEGAAMADELLDRLLGGESPTDSGSSGSLNPS